MKEKYKYNKKLLFEHWQECGKREGRVCTDQKPGLKAGLVVTTHGQNNFYVEQCIRTFKMFFGYHIYIVVFLNECEDFESLIQFCKLWNVDYVKITNQEKFGGLTATWNHGIRKCIKYGCTTIALSNDDVFFNPSITEIFTVCHDEYSHLDYYGPVTNNPGNETNYCQKWPSNMTQQFTITNNLNGFFMVFSVRALEYNKFDDINYFDPKYPFGHNEVDWFNRFKSRGGRARVVPQTFVYHYKLKLWRNGIKLSNHCVYTINIGNYEDTIAQSSNEIPDDFDFVCITDNLDHIFSLVEKNIIPIFVVKNNESSLLLQRTMKAMPHKFLPRHYKTSTYIDGNVYLQKKVHAEISRDVLNRNYDIISFDHPLRNTVLSEAETVIADNLEKKENVDKITELFRKDKFNDDVGLTETCVLVRRHEPLIDFSLQWSLLLQICKRDQIMFDYLCWKHNLNIKKHFCLRLVAFNKNLHSGSGSYNRMNHILS